jgi:hypothetical protein
MEQFMVYISYIGSILLAVCAAPLAWRSFRDGHSNGIDGLALICWSLGELFTLVYVLYLWNGALILNYGLNFLFLCVIVKFKLKPRGVDDN